MVRYGLLTALVLLTPLAPLHSQEPAAPWQDPSPHSVRSARVGDNILLEVLDWGGVGRPIVLLAGGGDTAHVFDDFAPKLTVDCHVFGITRRGFGASGFAAVENFSDRFGDDVLAVLDSLQLNQVVLAGHSFAGAELSSIGNRYPDRVAGLVYLDAMYPYAFNNGSGPAMTEFLAIAGPQPPPPSEAELNSFAAFQEYYQRTRGFTFPEAELRQRRNSTPEGGVGSQRDVPGGAALMAVLSSEKKYSHIPPPALVIFAMPHGLGTWVESSADPNVHEQAEAYSAKLEALTERQVKAFETGIPSATVVQVPGADHYVYLSNEADVLREMRAFLASLP